MVPGSGPQPCLGMIVGEAPGRQEVEQGLPFVGSSGKLLDTALRAVGIDRRDIYVTNVVKELPETDDGKIRRPYQQEVDAWLPILLGEIEATAPAAILALGRTAVQALTGIVDDLVPFGSKVGNIYTAWHPAYMLYRRQGEERYLTDWLLQIRPWAEAVRAAEL